MEEAEEGKALRRGDKGKRIERGSNVFCKRSTLFSYIYYIRL